MRRLLLLILTVSAAVPASSNAALSPAERAKIDSAVTAILKASATPSASIAVVKDGELAYVRAYGLAVAAPPVKATSATRYKIASLSKELVSAAALKLQEDGKLSLDDKVSKWLPDLTEADHITLRQLLTHTSGYSDYWPQDYLMTSMTAPTTPEAIMAGWAKKPLDFKPGTDWQYSNTGYVVAGRILEKAAGEPLFNILKTRVFQPVGITDAVDADDTGLEGPDAVGYEHRALGPLRRSAREGRGWLFSAGEFAMTAEDLARWDLSVLHRTLLKPESYTQEFTPAKLANGRDTGYALGFNVSRANGRMILSHTGEATGFLSVNFVYPDDQAAVVVLTNTMTGRAYRDIGVRISDIILPPRGVDPKMRALFVGLQQGVVNRDAFTANFNAYLDARTVEDYHRSLGSLGEPTSFRQTRSSDRGGMKFYNYRIEAGGKRLDLSVYLTKDDKVEQFLVTEATD